LEGDEVVSLRFGGASWAKQSKKPSILLKPPTTSAIQTPIVWRAPALQKETVPVDTRLLLRQAKDRLSRALPELVAYVGTVVFLAACAYGLARALLGGDP